ncbi:alanine racemase [Chromobacterium sp. IIBBL 290-4]|uniref:alanine racemase n=1 Tax=Chromobacterium sp. IIBBL 290-4 TaxID=2953890 RepID=UPI0020B64BC2|nr:alanine racemase [Chromobacterium sp. IIBBL 290-4]UTH72299.1 alanine racemase [Chromobacterium sp. IIBBL 290-4]
MTRPIRLEIDLPSIRHNFKTTRSRSQARHLFAVVKADAYGHGVLDTAKALADLADGFALLNIEDAVRLREAGITQPIALLEGPFDAAEAEAMAAYRIAGAIHSQQQIAWLAKGSAKQPVETWLKLNSGMNRLGFRPEEAPEALARLQSLPQAKTTTIMTHFATADDDYGVAEQWSRFAPVAAASGLAVSAANSAALFRHPQTHGDVGRPGIVLYGASPFEDSVGADIGLKPAMALSADIIAVQRLQPGDAVGYGRRFVADQPMRIGIVACGYADGYPRIAGNGAPVAVDGQASGLVGRVSMDMLAVDLSHLPQAGVGSRVELWGPNAPIERVAAASGTISYELMCAVAPRVPRIAHG